MHPDDVRDFVVASVATLRNDADASELPVTSIALEDGFNLFVDIELTRYAPSPMPVINGAPAVGAGIFIPGGGQMLAVPDLSVRPVRIARVIAFDLFDWDSQPPTAELLDANRNPLPPPEWPQKLTRRGLVLGHPNYRRPFFCRPGLREFHTHPQHEDEPWDAIRGSGVSLSALVLGLTNEIVSESLL